MRDRLLYLAKMITDKLKSAEKYYKLNKHFAKAFDFIKKAEQLDKGSYKIRGRKVFANVIYADKKPKSKLKLEAHKKYADIHFTISGKDLIGWKDIKNCRNKATEYNTKDDYVLFSDKPDLWVNVPKGNFAIFFPEDAHSPMRGKGKIKKIVVKAAV